MNQFNLLQKECASFRLHFKAVTLKVFTVRKLKKVFKTVILMNKSLLSSSKI